MYDVAQHERCVFDLSGVGTPPVRTEWTKMYPFTLNACFSPSENTITIPSALLVSRVFDLTSDEAAMASAGIIVAHELSHGFDDVGTRFSSRGTWGKWWPSRDSAEYTRRCALLDAQLRNVNLDPELARGEAIADLVGMRIALNALSRTADLRVFFVAWARMWRVKFTASQKKVLDRVDPHATGWARTVLPLRNFEEFYSTYHVNETDGMWLDPGERVTVF